MLDHQGPSSICIRKEPQLFILHRYQALEIQEASTLGMEELGAELVQEMVPQEMVPQEMVPQEMVPQEMAPQEMALRETMPQEAEDLHLPRIHHHLITEDLRGEDLLEGKNELRILKVPNRSKSKNLKSFSENQEKISIPGGYWYRFTSETNQKGFRKTKGRSTG
jgi:hypothetical protein